MPISFIQDGSAIRPAKLNDHGGNEDEREIALGPSVFVSHGGGMKVRSKGE